MGLRRRINLDNIKETEQALKEIVQIELNNGSIKDFGKEHLYTYFYSQMHIISR